MLKKYGIENPRSGLEEKVIGYQFGQKITVRDPYLGKKDDKPLKPFMVNNSVITFENKKIVFDPNDKEIVEQFGAYRIKSISPTGVPVFSSENEHIIDAVNLCLLVFEQNYNDLMKKVITTKVSILSPLTGREDKDIRSRDLYDYESTYTEYYESLKNGQSYIIKSTSQNSMFSRGVGIGISRRSF